MKLQTLQNRVDDNKIFCWSITLILGLTLRLIVMYITNHGDFEHWLISGQLAASGKNVYANIKNYNYAPLYSIILGYLYNIASIFANHVLAYKTLIVVMLSAADVLIARLITKKSGQLCGMLFFLNPVSIVAEGQNNQFDVIALLLAAYAIICLKEVSGESKFSIRDFWGIIFLSLSLIMKHIMWAFPLWILFNSNINSRKKFLYAFIPPLMFLLSFVPYWAEGSQGIIDNVFMYRSGNNYPLFALGIMNYYFGVELPVQSAIGFVVFTGFMFMCAYIFRHEELEDSFLVYTIAMVCFSSGVFGTYFTIPLMALFMYFRGKALFFFLPEATRFLASGNGTGHIMYSLMVWCLLGYLICYCRHKKALNML